MNKEQMEQITDLENLLIAENQRKQKLVDELSAARQEIARLRLFEPGRRATPMPKPEQIAGTQFSYWGIIDKEEAEA